MSWKMHYKKHSSHIWENEERLEKKGKCVVLSSHVFDDNVVVFTDIVVSGIHFSEI